MRPPRLWTWTTGLLRGSRIRHAVNGEPREPDKLTATIPLVLLREAVVTGAN